MTGFPVLNLSLIPRREVFKLVAKSDLFILSFCSRRMRNQLMETNIPIDEMEYQLKPGDLEIKVNNNFKILVMKMNGRNGLVHVYLLTGDEYRNYRLIVKSNKSLEEAINYYREHVLSTFNNVINFSCVLDSEDKLETNPILRYHQSFHNLTLEQLTHDRPTAKHLTKEDFDVLFGKLTVRNELKIHSERARTTSGQYQFQDGFNSKKVLVTSTGWVTMDAVINSKSTQIEVKWFEVPPAAQLTAFLKAWISKENMENLELFTLNLNFRRFPRNYFRDVLIGIQYENINSVRVKIQRVDGTHATVRIADKKQFVLKVTN